MTTLDLILIVFASGLVLVCTTVFFVAKTYETISLAEVRSRIAIREAEQGDELEERLHNLERAVAEAKSGVMDLQMTRMGTRK